MPGSDDDHGSKYISPEVKQAIEQYLEARKRYNQLDLEGKNEEEEDKIIKAKRAFRYTTDEQRNIVEAITTLKSIQDDIVAKENLSRILALEILRLKPLLEDVEAEQEVVSEVEEDPIRKIVISLTGGNGNVSDDNCARTAMSEVAQDDIEDVRITTR